MSLSPSASGSMKLIINRPTKGSGLQTWPRYLLTKYAENVDF